MFSWLVLGAGCEDDPCEHDVAACGDGEAFAFDASCEADEPLSVTLLDMAVGEPVPQGQWPRVHHGSQGGVHFELALRVAGLQPDYMHVQLDLDAMQCDDPSCGRMNDLAARTLDADDSMWRDDGEAALLPNIVLVLDREPSGPGEIRLDLVDPCGRLVELVHPAG